MYGCSENIAGPKPGLTAPKPKLTVLPPTLGSLPVFDVLTPAFTASLPSYPDLLIAEFTVDGYVGVSWGTFASAPMFAGAVDAQGYTRNDVCRMQVKFTYFYNGVVTGWGPGACNGTGGAFKTHWVDTAAIQGNGSVSRGGPIFQESYECPTNTVPSHGTLCWKYDTTSGHTFALRPLPAAIKLILTSGGPESSPGFIDLSPPGMWVGLQVSSSPVLLKNIIVPISKISWAWNPKPGGDGQTIDRCTGKTVALCSMYFSETGDLTVTAVVNGVQQTAMLTVQANEVTITPQSPSMKFSIEIPDTMASHHVIPRHSPSRQSITVSVVGPNGPIQGKTVVLTLTGQDSTAGHMHKNGTKPAGSVDITVVNTGPSGFKTVSFLAPEPSGLVTIKGTSSGARTGTAKIDVGMDLVEMTGGTGYSLVGGNTHGNAHPRNHYATQSHITALQTLIADFFDTYGRNLFLNDASLVRGGLYDFDIPAHPWIPGHWGHREGIATDVHTKAPAGNPASDSLTVAQKNFIKQHWLSDEDSTYKIFQHGAPDYHYHLTHP